MTTIQNQLKEIIQEILETADDIDEETNLTDLGLESIEVVELFVAIEKRFSVKIPESMFSMPKTIVILYEFIEKKQKETRLGL